eukprot:Sspe_Gene.60099::Locus_33075_Transcript_1_1_Confidence_1.000_Length_1789::g.60099::m.60099/K15376/GPHN; gephyrin
MRCVVLGVDHAKPGAVVAGLVERGVEVVRQQNVAQSECAALIEGLCRERVAEMVVTVGGVGLAAENIIPETTEPLVRRIKGAEESLRDCLDAPLSRGVVGLRDAVLVANLPERDAVPNLSPFLLLASAAVSVPPPVSPPAASLLSRPRSSPYTMLEMPGALQAIEALTPGPRAPVEVPLPDALGLVAAEEVVARLPHPPFRASVKDGYAMLAADGAGVFKVKDAVTAGGKCTAPLQPGTVCRVSTGGPVPDGADAVVQLEDTRLVEGDKVKDEEVAIEVLKPPRTGQDIRDIGVDIAAGTVVVPKGAVIGAAEVGLLACVGVARVSVFPRCKVAVMSTGDELERDGVENSIRDSNRPMLLAALRAMGCDVFDLGIARDNKPAIGAALEEGFKKADVVITSGGVSMGEKDLVKGCVEALGATLHFGRVEMKPGKPTTFGTTASGQVFFGLPGNPVSCLVCLHLFAFPAVRKMMAFPSLHHTQVEARFVADAEYKLDCERPEFCRAVAQWKDGEVQARATGSQASSRLLSMRSANSLLAFPKGTSTRPTVKPGEKVPCILIAPLES